LCDGIAIREEFAPIAVEVGVIIRFGWHWVRHVKRRCVLDKRWGGEMVVWVIFGSKVYLCLYVRNTKIRNF
jgi:hypothetical protein